MPYRTLGRTGEQVSLVGLGGAHIGRQAEEQESIRIIRTALDNGINFLDNSWDYNKGASEVRMGQALKDGYRQKAFLMTKFDGQSAKAARQQFEGSLWRLQVDYVDLLQFHEIIRMEDPERIFGPGGAFETMQALRQEGKVRYIGFTGHKHPDIHLKMIRTALAHGFTFDTVQMPINVMDAHFRSFTNSVLPVALEHGIGVLAMKSMGFGHILRANAVTPIECLHFAMSQPVSVVITGCDSLPILQQALEAARTFRPLTKEEVKALLARTATAAQEGEYEPFKVTNIFDDTINNPSLLGLESV